MDTISSEKNIKKINKFLYFILVIFILVILGFLYKSFISKKINVTESNNNFKNTYSNDFLNIKKEMEKWGDRINNFSEVECKRDLSDNYFLALAFGDKEELCPDKFKYICINDICPECQKKIEDYSDFTKYYENDEVRGTAELCEYTCDIIESSQKDEEFFNKAILDFYYLEAYADNPGPYIKIPTKPRLRSIIWRVAVANRVGKEMEIYSICDKFNDLQYSECREAIKIYNSLFRDFKNKCEAYF